MKELHPSLWVYEQGFENPAYIYKSIESFIDDNLSFNWAWAQTSKPNPDDSLQDAHRTNQIFSISSNRNIPLINQLDELIFHGTTGFIGQYSSHYDLGSLDDEGYAVLKYENGTMYKQHYDCGPQHPRRVLSMLVYLNDDYVGGELEFPYLGVKYSPKAGDVVLFPSNHTFAHIAHPVTGGTKYSVVTWAGYGNI